MRVKRADSAATLNHEGYRLAELLYVEIETESFPIHRRHTFSSVIDVKPR